MRPLVKQIVDQVAAAHGIPAEDIAGPKRRRTSVATAARQEVIVRLYDPTTAGCFNSGHRFRWGIAEIGRQLCVHHATVLRHVRLRQDNAAS